MALCLCLLMGVASSQEPPPEPPPLQYTTEIRASGDERLDAALRAVSQLAELQEKSPTTALGVLNRARADRDRFARALESEGYWGGTTRVTVAGLPVEAPDLGERLEDRRYDDDAEACGRGAHAAQAGFFVAAEEQ